MSILTTGPITARVCAALFLALAGSLLLDALLVALGTTAFPATRGYGHFHFSDYGPLTVIGVVLACAAWMAVARSLPAPRRFFFRLAVAVTLVLVLRDVWLLIRHEPPAAVTILICMHLGIALITYTAIVCVAPAGDVVPDDTTRGREEGGEAANGVDEGTSWGAKARLTGARRGRWIWILMMVGLGLELALGVVALVVVPVHRPSGWFPGQGATTYVLHAVLGGVLALAAMWLVTVAPRARIVRAGIVIGLAGLALGAVGGILAVFHSSQFAGLVLMFVGTLIAFFGYLLPLIEPDPVPEDRVVAPESALLVAAENVQEEEKDVQGIEEDGRSDEWS